MSTFGTPDVTITATSTPTANSGSSGGSNPTTTSSNTLYLYTFLTTLLLLLAVSCGIIFRSFVLRRRFRQRVEEAIAAGVLLPDGRLAPGLNGGRRGHDFGAKPIMHEVWMDHQLPSNSEKWEFVKPLSATVVPYLTSVPPASPNPPHPVDPTQPRFNPRAYVHGFFGITQRANPSQAPPPPTAPTASNADNISPPNQTTVAPSQTPAGDITTPANSSDNLVVSILIAMPNANRPTYTPPSLQLSNNRPNSFSDGEQETLSAKGKAKSLSASPTRSTDEEEELPDLVFGVSELPWTKDLLDVQEPPASSSAGDASTERR